MASPKSGNAPDAVAPAEPTDAAEAINDATGAKSEAQAEKVERATASHSSVKAPSFKRPTPEEIKQKELTWIEIELLDPSGAPIAGEPYLIELTDGSVARGILDSYGKARVDGIDPGSCKVSFPRRHDKAWKRK